MINDQVTPKETSTILDLAQECLSVSGDFVELGCYRGDTSILLGRLLAKNSQNCGNPVENLCKKRLWIYDSFAGLPEKTTEDNSGAGRNFQVGELAVTKHEVAQKIRRAGLRNITIKKAWFDELTSDELPTEIAFAFLDGDLYESIKTSLKLVLPLMNREGIIIVHDYNNPKLPGSSRAVDEFLRAHSSYQLTIRHTLAILRVAK